eukprot:SAG11_NODE_17_length_26125_cov_45.892723_4_plen_78_part_00
MGEQDPFFRMLTGAEHHHGECQLDFRFLGRKILTCRPGFGAFFPTPTCFSFYQVAHISEKNSDGGFFSGTYCRFYDF